MDWELVLRDAIKKGLLHIGRVADSDTVLAKLREARLSELVEYQRRLRDFIEMYTKGKAYRPDWLYWVEWRRANWN